MQIDIKTDTELYDEAKLFFGEQTPNIFLYETDVNKYRVTVDDKAFDLDYTAAVYDAIPQSHRKKRLSKIAVYDALSAYTGRSMPWGALTGVRPTKLFYELLREGSTEPKANLLMRNIYRISPHRSDILEQIVCAQSGKVNFPSKYYNLYVHIPYCTTRCSYCSFVSLSIDKFRSQSHEYANYLCDEIKRSVEYAYARGKKPLSIYIGGGTPSALDDEDFAAVLSAIDDAVNDRSIEYTCEVGRPDTVTDTKCDIMKAHGVTRVCVNPQTLNDDTLGRIGRSHTVDMFYRAYDMVAARGFDINCDLIAGLPGESAEQFIFGFNKILELKPQNFTVHSLSKKNGSALRYDEHENAETVRMLDHALTHAVGYRPYYLYRQKRQACNLENVGFSVPDRECINNITTMEETVSVLACGTGAISKSIGNGVITRLANMRDVGLYISRYDERLKAKFDFMNDL